MNTLKDLLENARLFTAKGLKDEAMLIIENLKIGQIKMIADFTRLRYFMLRWICLKKQQNILKAYLNQDAGFQNILLGGAKFSTHPVLQAALDKPELNALFEIRRKNMGLVV